MQGNHAAKEERIKELNQQVESLQNVILQVQFLDFILHKHGETAHVWSFHRKGYNQADCSDCEKVQELHHSLVAFCSELKNMEADVNVDGLGSAQLKQKLEVVISQLNDKKQSMQALRDNNSAQNKK